MSHQYKGTTKEWWENDLSETDKDNAQKALVNYIVEEELIKEDIAEDIATVHAVIGKMKKLDDKWKSVQLRNFNTGEHKAH